MPLPPPARGNGVCARLTPVRLCLFATAAGAAVVCAVLLLRSLQSGSWRMHDAVLDTRFALAVAPRAATRQQEQDMVRVHYIPSPLETEWSTAVRARAGRLCEAVEAEAPLWQHWFDAAAQAVPGAPKEGALGFLQRRPAPFDAAADARVWSTLNVAFPGAGDQTVRLEPLAGFLRDPRTSCRGVSSLQPAISYASEDAKGHIFLDKQFYTEVARALRTAQGEARRPRVLLFDIGSTRWFAAGEGAETGHRGIHWFVDTYARLGLPFDDIYAWEARPTAAAEYFKGMPLSVVARTHFLNLPVRAASGAAAGDGSLPDDIIAFIKTAAQPGDFVVLKLDIDAEELEERIVLDLMADDAALALIGDFYFEHHVENAVMGPLGWGPAGSHIRDIADSIHLFQALRRRGIRAHSWP